MNRLAQSIAAITALLAAGATLAQVPGPAERAYPEGSITGTVTSANGPEAGVWVIAETQETNTPLIKIVVTDDQGRYALPQLPTATYDVWVRGYGLVDSAKVEGRPGDADLDLTAVIAPTALDAAQYYPGDYWMSLLEIPPPSMFPGTGPVASGGNGYLPGMTSQEDWLHSFKKDCNFCHQLGNKLTRSLDHMDALGFDTHEEAWIYRTSLGVRGGSMQGVFLSFGMDGMAKTMADWTRAVEAGEVPEAPPRPSGIERNVVVTLWDIGGPQDFMHDLISTDKNNPTVNAYGPLYAHSSGHGTLEVVDPVTNDNYKYVIPTRQDAREVASRFPPPGNPSNFWGMEHLWGPSENPADPHNPMMGPDGRVWNTSKIRNENPAWCSDPNSTNKFVQYKPLTRSNRQASVFDPKTQEFELIDTCFATHHLNFATDADNTVYFNELLGPIFGWVNTRIWDETHDEVAAQGWCPQIVDTNGDGKITRPWNPANSDTKDPALDTEVNYNLYNISPDPSNPRIVWGANEGRNGQERGRLIRLDIGDNPPETCMTEVFQVPEGTQNPRGMDVASDGTPWGAMAATSQWIKLDRSKCERTNGPGTDISAVCSDDAWTVYTTPGPTYKNSDVKTDFHYFGWVDTHDILGLGKDTPVLTGSNSDSLIALNPETGEWTYMRVPYPMGFYQRGLDGRIDNPNGDWHDRALYSNYGTHFVWQSEGGKGFVGKAVKIQIRPDPLAL